jgi:hypothetical protein
VRHRRNEIAHYNCRDSQGITYFDVTAEVVPSFPEDEAKGNVKVMRPPLEIFFKLEYSLSRPAIYEYVFPMKHCKY